MAGRGPEPIGGHAHLPPRLGVVVVFALAAAACGGSKGSDAAAARVRGASNGLARI
jgi:hypothetical protein